MALVSSELGLANSARGVTWHGLGPRRKRVRNGALLTAKRRLPISSGHPLDEQPNRLFDWKSVDEFVDEAYLPTDAGKVGRRGLTLAPTSVCSW